MVRIAVNGAAGAMGRRIVALATEDPGCEVVCALERPDHPELGRDVGEMAGTGTIGVALSLELTSDADVLVDFSSPGSSVARARECAGLGVAAVIGTTGLSADQRTEIEDAAAGKVAVLIAPNMSVGVNLLFDLVERAARALGADYDVEIVEAHHRRKKDAPSGTAMELARRVCTGLDRSPDEVLIFGREGLCGARTGQEVAVHAVRGGDIVGDHTVLYAGDGERVELTHKAGSRDVFVRGALRAAAFLNGREPGVYAMRDVLAAGD